MEMTFLKCPDCQTAFSVDQRALDDDELVTCPKCEAEVDVEEDKAEMR